MKYDVACPTNKVERFKGSYNYDMIKDILVANQNEIVTTINELVEQNDVNAALCYLDRQLQKAH